MRNLKFLLAFLLPIQVFSQGIVRSMLRLPDTGQTGSFTTTPGEDSDYSINVPGYILHPNGTVTDTVTGLMWQQVDGGEMTYARALLYCDTLTLGNYTDWRLPNAHESFSILNMQHVNPAIDPAFTTTQAEYWWTANLQANDTGKVWVTNAGGGIGNHPKTETISAGGTKKFHVRAVRNTQPGTILPVHFVDMGDGTIADLVTGLVWTKNVYADTLTWENALQYADTFSLAGNTNWRLPNIREIQSLNDESIVNPSLSQSFFPASGMKKIWSSTSLPNQITKAWYLDSHFGITTYYAKIRRIYVLLVSGQGNVLTNSETKRTNDPEWRIFPNPSHGKIAVSNLQDGDVFDIYGYNGINIYTGPAGNFPEITPGFYLVRNRRDGKTIRCVITE